MRVRLSSLAALALLTLSAGGAHAEMVNFNYSWGLGPVSLSQSGVGTVTYATTSNKLTLTHATGGVVLTLPGSGSGTTTLDGPGGFSLPTGSFTASSTGVVPAGNQFFSAIVNTNLHVTDLSNGLSGDVPLQTTITGVIVGGTTTILASSFGQGYAPGLTLGEHRFGLNGTGFGLINPDSPPVTFSMQMGTASESSFHKPPERTPEPSSLLLGLGAASMCGMAALRRRRRG